VIKETPAVCFVHAGAAWKEACGRISDGLSDKFVRTQLTDPTMRAFVAR